MKRSLIIIALLLGCVSMQAQKTSFWHKINGLFTKRAVVDTTYIYQSAPSFSLGVFGTLQQAGFNTDVNFRVKDDNNESFSGVTSYWLSENLCKKVGVEAGFGNINIGYGFEVGTKSATKMNSLAFNLLRKTWGVRVNYYKITNPFTSGLTMGIEGEEYYQHDEFVSKELACLRSFTVDGYYVFNNKRFAYPATYKKSSLVQRHTAGSWMLMAHYKQGDLYNSPEASLDSYNLLDCFATMQVSVGGGYSANIVLWHKDPVGSRDEKLRNLTFNLTAMPELTVFNYLKTTSYIYNENGVHAGENVSKVLCYPMPNFIGSAAVSLTLGRIYCSTQFTYNMFYFRSRDAFDTSQMNIPEFVQDLNYQGTFQDWTLKGLLVYRF